MTRKPTRTLKVIAIANIIFLVSWLVWFKTDIPLKRWGNTTISSSNVLETQYFDKKNKFWKQSLKFIETHPIPIKDKLFKAYIFLMPVNHWWHQQFIYLEEAVNNLTAHYIMKGEWAELDKISRGFLEIEDRNARYYYYVGLAAENQGDMDSAKDYYFQALKVESTHGETLNHLIPLLIQSGDYQLARHIYEPLRNFQFNESKKLCVSIYSAEQDLIFYGCQSVIAETFSQSERFYFPLPNPQQLNGTTQVRLDIPVSTLQLNSISLYFENDTTSFKDFSVWNFSPEILPNNGNLFSSTGDDPYLYVLDNFENQSQPLKGVEVIISNYMHTYDPTFFNDIVAPIYEKN